MVFKIYVATQLGQQLARKYILPKIHLIWEVIAPPAVAECIYIIPELKYTDMVYGITLNGPACGKTHHS